jgi:molybdopterin synthase sulfur carrier subunit
MSGSEASGATVRVRLFASLREAAGWAEQSVRTDGAKATPLALWRQLGLGSPGPAEAADGSSGEALPAGVRVAVNQEFASSHAPLVEGDELAFLPPITGG